MPCIFCFRALRDTDLCCEIDPCLSSLEVWSRFLVLWVNGLLETPSRVHSSLPMVRTNIPVKGDLE
jgi:hypothetical protein